jgi:hypothetical protein
MVPGGMDFGEHVRGEERSKAEVIVQAIEYGEGQRRGGMVLCSGVQGGHALAWNRARESMQGRGKAATRGQ